MTKGTRPAAVAPPQQPEASGSGGGNTKKKGKGKEKGGGKKGSGCLPVLSKRVKGP